MLYHAENTSAEERRDGKSFNHNNLTNISKYRNLNKQTNINPICRLSLSPSSRRYWLTSWPICSPSFRYNNKSIILTMNILEMMTVQMLILLSTIKYWWGRSNVTKGYLFKCNRARHGAGVKTNALFSLWQPCLTMVKFPDVLTSPDDRSHQLCPFDLHLHLTLTSFKAHTSRSSTIQLQMSRKWWPIENAFRCHEWNILNALSTGIIAVVLGQC